MTRSVPRLFAAAAAGALSLSGGPCLASETVDPLWKSAVEIAAASQGWRPTRTVSRIEDLAKDGRVRSVDEVTHAYPPGDAEPRAELVRYLRDGVDVTEKERAKLAAQEKKASARQKKKGEGGVRLGVAGTPFDPERQAAVSFRRTSERRTIGGRACQAYEYSRSDDSGQRSVGTACLDEETGAPMSLRERPEPLPRFVDRLWVVLSFTYKGPGEWYPTHVEVEGSGGLLFIKKSIHTTIELLDFTRGTTGSAAR